MKSYQITSPTTLELSDENGNSVEWVRASMVKDRQDIFDFNNQMQIKGVWYVTKHTNGDEEE